MPTGHGCIFGEFSFLIGNIFGELIWVDVNVDLARVVFDRSKSPD